MILKKLIAQMKFSPRDAEVIFDRAEPVGAPTDLVMPARRWFGRQPRGGAGAPSNRDEVRTKSTTVVS